MKLFLPAALTWLVLLCAGVAPAMAHAVLVETVPEDAVRLEAPPADLKLRFNEPVRPLAVRLVGGSGEAIEAAIETRGTTLTLVPRAPLPTGGYLIEYRVASGDGHPVVGTIGFGVRAAPPPEDGAVPAEPVWRTGLALAARALHYGGLLGAVGSTLFLALVARGERRVRRPLLRIAVIAGMVALFGTGFGIVLAGTGLEGPEGLAPMVAVIGLALSFGAGLAGGRLEGLGLVTGAVIAAASLALTGHAASAPPQWLTVPAVAIHGLAASFWIGSLLPLSVVLRGLPVSEAALLVRRFSSIALVAVPVLLAAGVVLTLTQFSGMAGLANTRYGLIWLGKMAGVTGLLGLAALNRLRLTPALERGEARPLLLSIRAELLVAALVVMATAGLGAVPPPRALVAASEPDAAAGVGYATLVSVPGGTAVVEIDPARPGRNRLSVRFPGVIPGRAIVSPEGDDHTSAPFVLAATGTGDMIQGMIDLPAPGRWKVIIESSLPSLPAIRVIIPINASVSKP